MEIQNLKYIINFRESVSLKKNYISRRIISLVFNSEEHYYFIGTKDSLSEFFGNVRYKIMRTKFDGIS